VDDLDAITYALAILHQHFYPFLAMGSLQIAAVNFFQQGPGELRI
jgi:hypothetical protein